MNLLTFIVISSFVIMHTIEIASFGSRVAGRITNRVALGTTLAQTIYTTSRFLLIIFLPVLGFIVESGVNINTYLSIVLVTYIFTFVISVIIIFKLNKLQQFYQLVFNSYSSNTIPIAIIKTFITKRKIMILNSCEKFGFERVVFKKTLVSFGAYIFLITGFFIAFLLAVLFPENRLTVSQFTATFHGFGAVIFAFYLDPMLSRSIDSYVDDVSWLENIYSILLGRAISYLAMIICLSVYFLIDAF
jgi:hypothetical protein